MGIKYCTSALGASMSASHVASFSKQKALSTSALRLGATVSSACWHHGLYKTVFKMLTLVVKADLRSRWHKGLIDVLIFYVSQSRDLAIMYGMRLLKTRSKKDFERAMLPPSTRDGETLVSSHSKVSRHLSTLRRPTGRTLKHAARQKVSVLPT